MSGFIEGEDRNQTTLFPERLDNYITEDSAVRVIDAFVAIDGSKFKAVNNRDRNFTKAKMKRRLQQIDESIERYLVPYGLTPHTHSRRAQGSHDLGTTVKTRI